MRLSPLLCISLFLILAWLQLTSASGSESTDGIRHLMNDRSDSEDEVSSFRPFESGNMIQANTAGPLPDEQLRPFPAHKFPLPQSHPTVGELRPVKERFTTGLKIQESPSENFRDLDGSRRNPSMAGKRTKAAEQELGRMRRRKGGEKGGVSGDSEPLTSPRTLQREERVRTMRSLVEEGVTSEPRTRGQQTVIPNLFAKHDPPSFSPHRPPSDPLLRMPVPQGVVPPEFSTRDGDVPLQRATPPSDSPFWRTSQIYSFPYSNLELDLQPGTYTLGGLRYGYVTSQRLPPPPENPPPGAGSAKVLLPEHVRWEFPDVNLRQRSVAIVRDRRLKIVVRRMMAEEAKRLYEMEAKKIREGIQTRSELPLYTSEEWRNWVNQQGTRVLAIHLDSRRIRNMGTDIVDAQHRLARMIEDAVQQGPAVIRLGNEHERTAANYLVTWWTAAHEQALKASLDPVR